MKNSLMRLIPNTKAPLCGAFIASVLSAANADTLIPAFDSIGRLGFDSDIDKDYTGNLGVGPVKDGDFFRTYLTFDLTAQPAATGTTTLTLLAGGSSENNTSSVEQVFTLVLFDADWDGAAQPGPTGTPLATATVTPSLDDDRRDLSFSSEALTTAFNNALGSSLYLGVVSDTEGPDERSFRWFGSTEDENQEPQLIFTPPGVTYAVWIESFFPGELDPAIVGLNADPDNDGIDNGVENFFGTRPNEASQGLVAVTADPLIGTFTFTHPKSILSSDLTSSYTWSTDLITFFPADNADGTTVDFTTEENAPEAGFTTVTATVTGTSLPHLFVRAEVTQN